MYSFGSRNASATGENCAGVLEEKCVTYLRSALVERAEGLLGLGATCELAEVTPEAQEKRKEACGDLDLGSVGVRGEFPFHSYSQVKETYKKRLIMG